MAKPYSLDLRERVVGAVERDGMSRSAAAARCVAVLRKLTIPVLSLCRLEGGLCPPDWHRQWAMVTRGARLAMVAHALFIGRAELTIAYGAETPDDPQVVAAVSRICAAGKSAGRAIGIFLPRISDVPGSREHGASLLILGSDHDCLLAGAAALGTAIRN